MASSQRVAAGMRRKSQPGGKIRGGRNFAGPELFLIPGFRQLSRRLMNSASVKKLSASKRARSTAGSAEVSSGARGVITSHRTLTGLRPPSGLRGRRWSLPAARRPDSQPRLLLSRLYLLARTFKNRSRMVIATYSRATDAIAQPAEMQRPEKSSLRYQ